MARSEASDPLDQWVLATAPRAVAYATSLLRDVHAAEDVVQDCYCRLLAKADVYDLPRDGLKLLMRSITNACINQRTRRRPMLRLHRNDPEGEGSDDPADPRADSPDALVMGKELETAIAAGLAELPQLQRAAVELRSLGHSQQEVAEILGVSSNHAGVLIHRARQALSRLLAPFLERETEP